MKAILAIVCLCIPPFLRGFDERYSPAIGDQFAAKVAEARCNVCHAGTSKKQKNAYGQALGKVLSKDRFSNDRQRTDPQGFRRELLQGLQAVESVKAADGRTYAERISAGELPASQ